MKLKIIVIVPVVILLLLSAFAVKKYIDNSVTDKYGMVREGEDTVKTTDLFGKGVD